MVAKNRSEIQKRLYRFMVSTPSESSYILISLRRHDRILMETVSSSDQNVATYTQIERLPDGKIQIFRLYHVSRVELQHIGKKIAYN